MQGGNTIGPTSSVLSAVPVIYHTCKYLLLNESVNSHMVLVDSQTTSIIYRYGSVKSLKSLLTAILRSTDYRQHR